MAMEEQKDLKTFMRQVKGTRKGRPGKVTNSFGVYDCYKAIRKKGWYNIGRPVTEKEFYSIIRGVNKLLAEELSNGKTVKLPERMGKLELRKFKCSAFMSDNKLKITYPVDWSETLKLWYEDAEAHKNKTLLRNENPYVYHYHYCTSGNDANYENKMFYKFVLNTFVKKALSMNIKKGVIDTLWLQK